MSDSVGVAENEGAGDAGRRKKVDTRRGTQKRGFRRLWASRVQKWSGGTLAALAAAIGVLVGLRSVVRLELPRLTTLLELRELPRSGLGVVWSPRAVWAADLQTAALERLIVVIVALFLTAALVATLNAVILLAESAGSRRGELAVRSAVGASPARLARMMISELRTLLFAGSALGLGAGLIGGGLARAAWPGRLVDPAVRASGDVISAAASVCLILVMAYLAGGWHMARAGRTAVVLRAGTRTGADPIAVFVRKVLAATHVTVAGTVLVGTLALAGAVSQSAEAPAGSEGTVAYSATAPAAGAWPDLLGKISSIPGIEAESLAAPGALLDLGVRDIAIAECGRCSRGGLPAPLWNALADHQAVAPGYFDLVGLDILEGRAFTADDAAGGERVALVNETFALTAFENGQPIGKRVRVGSDFANWYEVVGIVADTRVPVLGGEDLERAVVYMNALQQSPQAGVVLVRGDPDAVAEAENVMSELGFAPEAAMTVAEFRSAAARTLAWSYRVAALIALLSLATAVHGVYTTALQTTRRRTAELAIRRAVGATARRIVTYVLGERVRVTGWGLAGFAFFGTLLVALLQNASGMKASGPVTYGAIAVLLLAVALVASGRAAVEALAVEPAAILE